MGKVKATILHKLTSCKMTITMMNYNINAIPVK